MKDMPRQLRRRLGREAIEIPKIPEGVQVPMAPNQVKVQVALVNTGKEINNCPIYVGIPLKGNIDHKKLAQHCVAGIIWMIERCQIPNVKDVYEMSIERITRLELN